MHREREKPPPPPTALERALEQAITMVRGAGLGAVVGCAAGAGSALFLELLDRVTRFRTGHGQIVYALPACGLVLGLALERWGASVRGGNDLILETVHAGGPRIPKRMAPVVILGTVATHLFGGSAGREGTAVQMGAGLADLIAQIIGAAPTTRRRALVAGMAGGFGSVFGTPVAGAIFGLEAVGAGRVDYGALLPAVFAAVVGDLVTRALGTVHTPYPTPASVAMSPALLGKWVLFALAVAAVTATFVELTHAIKRSLAKLLPRLPVRMMLGGAAVVAMWLLVGTDDYLGLGVPTILRAFHDPGLPAYAFGAKLVFTAVTLGAGFLGGEVTPLFFVGAALGNALAGVLGLPLDLAAGVGLAAVFGTAANAPLALAVMAVELLGAGVLPHVVLVTVVAYLASGHRGIYAAQRLLVTKGGDALDAPARLDDARARERDYQRRKPR